ncbi:PP2C family protein-serine/threonine phosphatase [Occallatibacter savannae]|uniref:PP2C family protein-serine/threonine phosphatase n=1 Tax=Occallatibacter savannae TaxID=1002691 RepID=UPI001EF5705A|nr:PP2C family protein-serine/threonine phosphatase [Occallatibacter savannae]
MLETQLTAGAVLRAFHHDEPFLFLGAAFNTVTIILIGLCVIRRKPDGLLLSLAWFAHLYGIRLWMNSELLGISEAPSEAVHRIRAAVDYLVPVPAWIFFKYAGFLGRLSKNLLVFLSIFIALAVAALVVGPRPIFHHINNAVVIFSLAVMAVRWSHRMIHDRESRVIGIGLLTFILLALIDNLSHYARVEPYGFAVLLACLGYVAARRTLQRDREYSELQQELDLARRIQLSILPSSFPPSQSFRVAAKYVPMTSVAGDLYDFLIADDQQAGLLIADVSGHGVPAALIASMVKMAATSQRDHASDPAALLRGMNSSLCGNTQGQYVTAAYVYLDAQSKALHYSAAGHPAMLLLRDGNVTEVAENGLLLAAIENATYESKSLPLQPGDRLLLYTDGIVEARNDAGQLFGDASLSTALKDTRHLTPSGAVDHLLSAVQRWAKSQDDDLTVLICDYVGAAVS